MNEQPKCYLSSTFPGGDAAHGHRIIALGLPICADKATQGEALRAAVAVNATPTHRFNCNTGSMIPLHMVLADALTTCAMLAEALREAREAVRDRPGLRSRIDAALARDAVANP